MACAKTCVLLCHCCRCCCKDYTELFYLLTARSVYPYNFCMSYSMCTCVCVWGSSTYGSLSLSFCSQRPCSLWLRRCLCVAFLRSTARPNIYNNFFVNGNEGSSSLSLALTLLLLCLSVSFYALPHTPLPRSHSSMCMQSTEIETCNKWPCLTFCSGRAGRIEPREPFTSFAIAIVLQFVHFNGSWANKRFLHFRF